VTLSENFEENKFLLVIVMRNKFKYLEISKIDVQRDVGAWEVKCQNTASSFLQSLNSQNSQNIIIT